MQELAENTQAISSHYIGNVLGLKVVMPDDWKFGEGDPLARLHAGGIVLTKQ